MQAFCDVFSTDYFEADADRRRIFTCDVIKSRKLNTFDVSNVIYHKFSHGAVSYTLNEENVNVMLELKLNGINNGVTYETETKITNKMYHQLFS